MIVIVIVDGDTVVVVDNDPFGHTTTKEKPWMRK